MAQLAQAYVHLQPYTVGTQELHYALAVGSKDLEQLGRTADAIAQNAALRIYSYDTEVDVRLEEGSLKVWVTVVGALWGAYQFVGNYKGFKEGITELCNDARKFGFNVCDAFTREAGASPHQVYRIEKRLKTPGKIDRAIKIHEKLDADGEALSSSEQKRLLGTLRRELEAIQRDLNPAEMSTLKATLNLEKLPPEPDWPKIPPPHMPRVALRSDSSVESIATENSVLGGYLRLQAEQGSGLIYHNRVFVRARRPGATSS